MRHDKAPVARGRFFARISLYAGIVLPLVMMHCRDGMFADYEHLDIPQTKLGVLFLAEKIEVNRKNIFGREKDIKNESTGSDYFIRDAIMKDCRYLTKFKNVTVDNLDDTRGFKRYHLSTASMEKYDLLLPDSGTIVSTVSNEYDFILFIQGYKITVDSKVITYGNPFSNTLFLQVRSGCINHDGAYALWDNVRRKVIKYDFVHAHECTEDRRDAESNVAVSTLEFVKTIFEDTPFGVKLLDAGDFN